jgi:2-oxoglutarate dehydrogenase complex dehydrogenase (E1) component-like enzyme
MRSGRGRPRAHRAYALTSYPSGSALPTLSATQRRHILHRLVVAEAFEHYLQTRYIGHKRFSIEGTDALVPMLDAAIERLQGL